jgi:L-erythro-3,5-diaminohexanoate dehydrogenase
MAAIRKYAPQVEILGIDAVDANFEKIKRFQFTNRLAVIDAVDAQSVVEFANDCDFVVNCVNVSNTEASSVLAAREGGLVMFFSMATQFDKASLATDATGKDVVMMIASGIATDEDKEIFQLLEEFPGLISVAH